MEKGGTFPDGGMQAAMAGEGGKRTAGDLFMAGLASSPPFLPLNRPLNL